MTLSYIFNVYIRITGDNTGSTLLKWKQTKACLITPFNTAVIILCPKLVRSVIMPSTCLYTASVIHHTKVPVVIFERNHIQLDC